MMLTLAGVAVKAARKMRLAARETPEAVVDETMKLEKSNENLSRTAHAPARVTFLR
jgi:hypothetical protein